MIYLLITLTASMICIPYLPSQISSVIFLSMKFLISVTLFLCNDWLRIEISRYGDCMNWLKLVRPNCVFGSRKLYDAEWNFRSPMLTNNKRVARISTYFRLDCSFWSLTSLSALLAVEFVPGERWYTSAPMERSSSSSLLCLHEIPAK